jgi:hypothetical protein
VQPGRCSQLFLRNVLPLPSGANICQESKDQEDTELKMEAEPFSETSVNIYQASWRHIPEDTALQGATSSVS